MDLYTFKVLTTILSIYTAVNANNHSDKAIVLTGIPTQFQGYKNVISIPFSPLEVGKHSTSEFNGFAFGSPNHLFIACDVDYDRNQLYLYDYDSKQLILGENFNSSAMKDEIRFSKQHYSIGKEYVKIAVDWVSHNVYWTDTLMNAIVMQPGGAINDSTLYSVIVFEYLDAPRGIAVDPINGYLFWTLSGRSPRIERSSLVGEDKTPIVVNGLQLPFAIVTDITAKRIYWTDANSIGSATYYGTDRRHFTRYTYSTYGDIALYEDVILAVDYRNGDLNFFDKNTGKAVVDKVAGTAEDYFSVCVYDNSTRPPTPKDRCKDKNCTDMCVNEPDKATCVCRTGFRLVGTDCIEIGGEHHRAVIINTGTDLCKVDIRIFGDHHDYTPVCFYKGPANETITSMDLNMATREVYFATDRFIYSVAIDNHTTGESNQRDLLVESAQDINGLTFDWMNNHIYYAMNGDDTASESIWVLEPNTRYTIIRQLATGTKPRDLVAVPHEEQILWIAGTNKIEYAYLGEIDAEIKEIDLEINFTNPTHMYHDLKFESLFVLDDRGMAKYLIEIFYNGSYVSYLQIDNSVQDFVLYKDYILLAQSYSSGVIIKSADITLGNPTEAMDYGKLPGITSVRSMKILDKEELQPNYPNPCGQTMEQGGCEQICLPNGRNSKCACKMGFTLGTDGKKCTAEPVKDDFIMVSDITFSEIYQISLAKPTEVVGIRTPNIGRPNGVLYNYLTGVVTWASDTQKEIWSIQLDGSNRTLISRTGYEMLATPNRLALDPSTGNLYYSALSDDRDILGDSFIGIISPQGYDNILIWEGYQPSDIVLHPEKGYMFWSENGDEPAIFRANMDGNDGKPIITDELTWPNGLAIDYAENKLYWADGFLDTISHCDFDGKNRAIFLEDKNSHLMDLSIVGEYLYYTAWDKHHITRVKKNDSNDVFEIGPPAGLGLLHAMDIYSSQSSGIPVSSACSTNNGGCSHFCLPTPEGNTCGCDWFNSLLSDGKNCRNAPRCPLFLEGAIVIEDDTCLRLVGNECSFKCSQTHRNKHGIISVTCTNQTDDVGYQKWDVEEPCQEIFCSTIPNVILPSTCTRTVGENCGNYTCSPGYERNNKVSDLVCGTDESWSNSQPLCIERCPVFTSGMEHATLQPSCMRGVGDVCKFTCDEKYKYSSDVNSVTCMKGSMWNNDTRQLCQEIKCKDYIDNGVVNETCSLLLDAVCQYHCYDSFEANPEIEHISCQGDGVWDFITKKTKRKPCIAIVVTEALKQNMVGVSVGVGVGAFVLIILIIILLVFLFRAGKLTFGKKEKSGTNTTSFENPRYVGDSVNIQPVTGRESEKGFGYATLEDETASIPGSARYETFKFSQNQAATAQNNTYDNSPSVS